MSLVPALKLTSAFPLLDAETLSRTNVVEALRCPIPTSHSDPPGELTAYSKLGPTPKAVLNDWKLVAAPPSVIAPVPVVVVVSRTRSTYWRTATVSYSDFGGSVTVPVAVTDSSPMSA